ncbi:hypothetical protein P3T24_001048 [Paraburkholderia sp. GAS33]|jgi:hypothetical protein|uniref:hypothetical protein n=1 Tax=Paraburkholderia sp. GAS33 TaxID=3035130 RepID=UPI003D196618
MRATILGTFLIALFCILTVALCESKTIEHLVLDGSSDDVQQQDTYIECAHYPLGFWTTFRGDFHHGLGRLQATYDRYHFSYLDAIDAATTLPIETLALEQAHPPTTPANRSKLGASDAISTASDMTCDLESTSDTAAP